MNPRTLIGDQVRGQLRRRGWIVEKRSPRTDEALRRAAFLREFRIGTVLDVGANVGNYGKELRAHGYAGRIVSFEPLDAPYSRLVEAAASDSLWETRQLALGAREDRADVNVSVSDPWSSLLPRDPRASTEDLSYVGQETATIAALDSLEILDGTPSWLKIDVQGFELQVLEGARAAIDQLAAIECEMCLEPFYVGQPTVRQLVDALDDCGFRLVATSNGYVRQSGHPMWMNGVFSRDRR